MTSDFLLSMDKKLLRFGTIALLVILISATMIDARYIEVAEAIMGKTAVKYIKYFSFVSNWRELIRSTSKDGQKLKAIQGMRVLSTMSVIHLHISLTLLIYFMKNPIFVEQLMNTERMGYGQIGFGFGTYVVQVTFLISGWLLANSVQKYITRKEDFSIKAVIHLIVYRYLRFFPVMFILQCWERSNWFHVKHTLPYDVWEMDRIACKKYWWRSLLLISNFFEGFEQCNTAVWSLANDFQMYVISVCLFYIIFKYKKSLMLFVYMTAVFGSIHGYEMYKHGHQHILAFVGERDLDASGLFGKGRFIVMYSSLYVNFGSYAIGVIFGSFYNKYKNMKIEDSLRNNILWACFMFVLPSIILYMATFTYSALWAAIIGPFVKPTISLCLSIGIFGMVFGLGGFFRRFCESHFMQLIANWQYSVYLVHLGVVFMKVVFVQHLFYVSLSKMALIYVCDFIGAYVFGLVIYLSIEKPFSNIVHDLMHPSATKEAKEKQDR
ncbi:unnamed protein product [Callosobruchus maculatus]|uniref:Acyltransferase 3 domain-containing protein n=2 Tax=Callosobruchus maculatus TaxID=64391 RepID=A0A653BG80_CALMS|nr:unnamed protein product [Callosobruchus maculatus]